MGDVREAAPDTPDMRSLGAWMDHSGFVFSHALSVDDGWETTWRYDLAGRRPHSVSRLRFDNAPVRLDGTFDAGVRGNRIAGGFYGPDRMESVGVMEQPGIVGSFGALRQEGR